MKVPVRLTGAYRISNRSIIEEKSNRHHDQRHTFYRAMLRYGSYDDYEEAVGDVAVQPPPPWKQGPVTGHGEMMYARRNGWIVDS